VGAAAFLAIARASARRHATYRMASLAGIFTNCCFGVLLCSMLQAVTTQRPLISGMDESDLLTQIWLSQGLLMVTHLWGWFEVSERIRSGDITSDLLRPMNVQTWWLAADTGRAAATLLLRGVAPFVVGALLYHLRVPTRLVTAPLVMVSVTLSCVMSFALRFLVNSLAFWLGDARSVMRFAMVVWTTFSGAAVSLALFPDWLEGPVRLLPFAGLFQAPVDVWLERPDWPEALALQAVWTPVLMLAGRGVLRLAEERVVANGG
jgi:ABC-2 type transport system permease protein